MNLYRQTRTTIIITTTATTIATATTIITIVRDCLRDTKDIHM